MRERAVGGDAPPSALGVVGGFGSVVADMSGSSAKDSESQATAESRGLAARPFKGVTRNTHDSRVSEKPPLSESASRRGGCSLPDWAFDPHDGVGGMAWKGHAT